MHKSQKAATHGVLGDQARFQLSVGVAELITMFTALHHLMLTVPTEVALKYKCYNSVSVASDFMTIHSNI